MKRNRGSLAAGVLMGASGVVAASFGVNQLIHGFNLWLSSGVLWGPPLNVMMADSLMGIILMLPSVLLFLTAYLLMEGNSKGVLLSSFLAVILLGLVFFGMIGFEFGLAMGILSALAAMAEFITRRRSGNERLDSPIVTENVVKFGLRFSGLICVGILVFIVAYISVRGIRYVSWDFITSKWISWRHAGDVVSGVISAPLGGIFDFVAGSFLLCSVCEAIAIPLGLGAAIYMAEYASDNILTKTIRFFIETLAGVPSILIGLVGFAFFCIRLNMGRSLLAGGISLAFMILPWNIRVAEESMKAVPYSYREGAYALGASKWQMVRNMVVTSAVPGILTGILLGLGGAFGETAVVMLTAGDIGATQMPNGLALTGTAIPSLPVWVYGAFQSLFSFQGEAGQGVWEGQNASLAGSFVLLVIFLTISVAALIARNYFVKRLSGK